MKAVNNGEHPGESSITFLPMIDMDPGDMCYYCLFNTFVCFCRCIITQWNACGNIRSAIVVESTESIISCERDDSKLKSIVLRLGAFHMQMSFLGSIGYLMHDSGLKETLESIYAPHAVTHRLSGKAVFRAVRGHFIVDSALNTLVLLRVFGLKILKPDQFPAVIFLIILSQKILSVLNRTRKKL